MPTVFVVTIGVIALGRLVRHAFGLPRVAVGAPLVVAGAVLWGVTTRLHARALRRAADALAAAPGGSHGVPRWIEELRNVAFALALAGLVPLVDDVVPD